MTYKKSQKQLLSLGDLVAAVSSFSNDDAEMLAALADLMARGRVWMRCGDHRFRMRLALPRP